MAKVMEKLGHIRCHCCNSVVPLKKQANSYPMYVCQECDWKGQSFSEDSGKRLMAQRVDKYGEAANDDLESDGNVTAVRSGIAAPAVAEKPEKKSEPPKRQSIGAALADAFNI